MTGLNDNKPDAMAVVCCFAVCYGVFLFFYLNGNWFHISVPALQPSFADFLFILAGSDCMALGVDVVIENPCDPWGRAHNYGLLWLQIGKLGLTREDTVWVALTLNAVFVCSALLIIAPSTIFQMLIAVSFLISPAVMLGLERANADLLIFSLLALSFFLISRENLLIAGCGSLIILLTAVLKLYPVVVLPVLVLYYSTNRSKCAILLTTLLMFALYLYFNWADISHLMGVIPNITWHYSMGGELLFSRLGYPLDDLTRYATNGIALIVVFAGIIWACRTQVDQHNHDFENDWFGLLYLCGAVLVVFSFVIKNSFDYRNIYFLLLLPLLMQLVFNSQTKMLFKITALMIVCVYGLLFWAEFLVSVFHDYPATAKYIRITESILNWLVMVPIVMFAMRTAIGNAQSSPLMAFIVNPLQNLFANKRKAINYE